MDHSDLASINAELDKLTSNRDCVFVTYKNINLLAVRIANHIQICPEYPTQFHSLPEHDQLASYFRGRGIEFDPNAKGGMLAADYNMIGDDDINETNDYDGKDNAGDTYDKDDDGSDDGKEDEGKYSHK